MADMGMQGTQREVDQNGFVTIPRNPISRSGIFQYSGRQLPGADPNKIYSVYRPAEEMAHPDAIKSFRMIPFFDQHVMVGDGYDVHAETIGTHGATGEDVSFEDGVLYSTIRIFSKTLKDLLNAGKTAISLGYRCAFEKTAGVFNGQAYDYIQRNLRGNHLALVDQARCDVAILDHWAFDNFDIAIKETDMADEENKADDITEDTQEEMSLADVCALLKTIVPQIAAINEAIAKVSVVEEEEDLDPDTAVVDEDDKKKKEEKKDAMDAAVVSKLNARIAQLEKRGEKDIVAAISERNKMAAEISWITGSFAHDGMTLDEVAQYGIKKIGIDAPKGQERAVLSGYLAGHKKSASTTGFALDGVKPKAEGKLAKRLAAHA